MIVAKDAAAKGGDDLGDAAGGFTIPIRIVAASIPGASAARNAGWRAGTSPIVLFLDDDILPSKRMLAEHLAWHQRNREPRIGVLGPVQWARNLRVTPFMRWLEKGIQFDYGNIEGTEAGWERCYSCNVSVKRELIESVDGFDEEAFPFGYEDLDLGRRMSRRGFRLLYNRAALGEHLRPDSEEAWTRRMPRIAAAERRFVQRYPEMRPYFHDLFRAAADAPPPRGRGARLVHVVPPRLPLLGAAVWRSYDQCLRRSFAPAYFRAWDAAERGDSEPEP